MVEEEIESGTESHWRQTVEDRTAVGVFRLVGARNLGGERRTGIIRRRQIDDGRIPAAPLIAECESVWRLPDVHDLLVDRLLHAHGGRRCPTGVFERHGDLIDVLEGEGNADGIDQLTVGVENADRGRIVETRSVLVGRTAVPVDHQPNPVRPTAQVLIADLPAHDVRCRQGQHHHQHDQHQAGTAESMKRGHEQVRMNNGWRAFRLRVLTKFLHPCRSGGVLCEL